MCLCAQFDPSMALLNGSDTDHIDLQKHVPALKLKSMPFQHANSHSYT